MTHIKDKPKENLFKEQKSNGQQKLKRKREKLFHEKSNNIILLWIFFHHFFALSTFHLLKGMLICFLSTPWLYYMYIHNHRHSVLKLFFSVFPREMHIIKLWMIIITLHFEVNVKKFQMLNSSKMRLYFHVMDALQRAQVHNSFESSRTEFNSSSTTKKWFPQDRRTVNDEESHYYLES